MGKSNNILIDTNILIYMYENKRDIFEYTKVLIPDAKFFILDKGFDELSKVYKDKPRKLSLIINYLNKLKEINKFEVLEVLDDVLSLSPKFQKIDNLLIYYSNKYLIYTNDKILKDKIKKKGNKVLTLRLNNVLLI
jgi:rRNA-processing protein FCF1